MEAMKRDATYISERCKYIRKVLGWTQENLADAANLTTRTIEKVESGRHTPSEQTLRLIAGAVGFDLNVFAKPTPQEELEFEKGLERAARKHAFVPTLPIRTAQDFYTRNREWDGLQVDTSNIENGEALRLAACISDWMTDLDGIWQLCNHAQKLEYSENISELCREMEALGYLVHFGSYRQQHTQLEGLIANVCFVAYLPSGEYEGQRYALVELDEPWEVPTEDRATPPA